MKKVVAFGDENAERSLYNFLRRQDSYPGLTVNDSITAKRLEWLYSSYDIIFWCNSHPLVPAYDLIKSPYLFDSSPQVRTISSYRHHKEIVPFAANHWDSLTQNQISRLVKNYFEINRYFMTKYFDKIVILPITAYILDRTLPYDFHCCDQFVARGWRTVNLEVLDGLFDREAFTKEGALTEIAYILIEPEILKFID